MHAIGYESNDVHKNRVVASPAPSILGWIVYWLCVDKFVAKGLRCNPLLRASGCRNCTLTCSGG
jgi:hypothetical protein